MARQPSIEPSPSLPHSAHRTIAAFLPMSAFTETRYDGSTASGTSSGPNTVGPVDSALIVALVGVVAAILGSAVGGVITGWVALRVERERHERERARDADREAASARAVARVTSAPWGAALAVCVSTLDHGVWWAPGTCVPPSASD
jgi:hypothetical protein